MALIESLMVKNFGSVTSVSLTPPPGKAYKVKNILISNLVGDATIKVEKTVIGFFNKQIAGFYDILASHIEFPIYGLRQKTIIERLAEKGIDISIPVAEGETFVIEFTAAPDYGVIIYEVYDAGDIKNTDINGSASDHYIYLSYGQPAASVAVSGYVELTKPMNPAQFPDFPFGQPVPAGKVIKMHAILAVDWGYNSYTGAANHQSISKYLRLLKETKGLFDNDLIGFVINGAPSAIGSANLVCLKDLNFLPYGYAGDPHDINFFVEPLVYEEGDILHVEEYVDLGGTGDSIPLSIPYIACILEITPKG